MAEQSLQAQSELENAVRHAATVFGARVDQSRVETVAAVLARSRLDLESLLEALDKGCETWQRFPAPSDVIRLAAQLQREQDSAPIVDGEPVYGLTKARLGQRFGEEKLGPGWFTVCTDSNRLMVKWEARYEGRRASLIYGPGGLEGDLELIARLVVDDVGIARYVPAGRKLEDNPGWNEPLSPEVQRRAFGRVFEDPTDPMVMLQAAISRWCKAPPQVNRKQER